MTDKIPKKLITLLKQYDISAQKNDHGALYIIITDEHKRIIPFENLSNELKVRGKNRINLNEMITTMRSKKKIQATTRSNAYVLVRFYEAIDRLIVDEDTFEVKNDNGLFRDEDKFCFRLVENLKRIFPGIEKKVTTQHIITSLRREHKVDIHIQISDTREICIEFDEKPHMLRDKQVSDTAKRNLFCNSVELRIFKLGIDEFDHFLKAICYDIIKYHDRPEQKEDREERTAQLIAHNLRVSEKSNVKVDSVRCIIEMMSYPVIQLDLLAEHILNVDVKDIRKFIRLCIKNGTINEDNLTYDDDKVSGMFKKEATKLIMLYNDPQCDVYRIMYNSIIQEYINFANGDYNIYQYRCTRDIYIDGIVDEAEAYRSEPMKKTRQVYKNVERKSIKDFPDTDICKSVTSIRSAFGKTPAKSTTKSTIKSNVRNKPSNKSSKTEVVTTGSDSSASDDDDNDSDSENQLSEEEIDEL